MKLYGIRVRWISKSGAVAIKEKWFATAALRSKWLERELDTGNIAEVVGTCDLEAK